MAVYVTKTAFISVGGTDLTAYVKQLTFDMGNEEVDATAMTNNTRIYLPGLKTASLTIDFLQNMTGATVDSTLGPLIGGAAAAIIVRGTNAAVGPNNPQYAGSMILSSYTPVGGNVGEMATAKATFKPAGDITRTAS